VTKGRPKRGRGFTFMKPRGEGKLPFSFSGKNTGGGGLTREPILVKLEHRRRGPSRLSGIGEGGLGNGGGGKLVGKPRKEKNPV